MKRSIWCRATSAAFVLMGTGLMAWFVLGILHPKSVQAHFCDDFYVDQRQRENCWWQYWNGLSTQQSSLSIHQNKLRAKPQYVPVQPVPKAPVGFPVEGRVCDIYYFEQEDRANCWWRWHNGLPLFALAPSGLVISVPALPVLVPPARTQAPSSIPAYQAPVPYTTFPPPRGTGSRCTDFDTRGQYEAFYAGRAKPRQHDRDNDGLYCEILR